MHAPGCMLKNFALGWFYPTGIMHTCFWWYLPETLNFRVDTGISWLWGLLGWSWCILQAIRHESGGLRVEHYESNCAPSKFICWSPTSQCDCIWSNKVIKVKWSHKGGTLISWCNRRHQRAYSLSPPCEDTGRRQPGRESLSETDPAGPWSGTSQSSELWEKIFV